MEECYGIVVIRRPNEGMTSIEYPNELCLECSKKRYPSVEINEYNTVFEHGICEACGKESNYIHHSYFINPDIVMIGGMINMLRDIYLSDKKELLIHYRMRDWRV